VQRSTLTSRFLSGFTPALLPPRGPDGLIPAPPPRSLGVLPAPSLCEAGPCRNYHRIASVMDAQDPVGESGPTRRQITRACYPTPGIELELGETPVLQCSRWEPDNEQARLDSLRAAFMKTVAGKEFAAQVAAFERAQELDDAQDQIESESAEAGGGLTGIDSDLAEVSNGHDELGDMIVDDAIGGAL